MIPPQASSPDDSSLPQRSPHEIDSVVNDAAETEFWAIDSPSDGQSPSSPTPRSADAEIPARREAITPAPRYLRATPSKNTVKLDRISLNVGINRFLVPPTSAEAAAARSAQEFEQMDQWEETSKNPNSTILLSKSVFADSAEVPAANPAQRGFEIAKTNSAPIVDEVDEFAIPIRENAVPISLRPRLKLSAVEMIGVIVLAILLLVIGGYVYQQTVGNIPRDSDAVLVNRFPIKGQHFTLQSAVSYWRAPKEKTEIFRRGTQLLPVVKLTTGGPTAAVRVFFKDGDGKVMGDAVTRAVTPGSAIEIPATAGFEDFGMYAAYRTGDSKPWTIQIYEAPSTGASSQDFKKICEMNVAADRL